MIKVNKFWFLFILLVLLAPFGLAKAANLLPDIMQGSTKVTITDSFGKDNIYYGGLTGNFAVYNPDPDSSYGFRISDLYIKWSECLLDHSACFVLGKGIDGTTSAGTARLMTGRTFVTGSDNVQRVAFELPALYFGNVNVFGDAYLGSSDLNYLRFWGQSLAQGSEAVNGDGAAWRIQNYTFNPEAQVEMSGDDFQKYREKMDNLAEEGTVISKNSFRNSTNYWLQAGGINLFSNANESDKGKYPDGKVWVVNSNLTLDEQVTYHGTGTIIVNGGDFTLDTGGKLKAADDNSRLGIIVLKKNSSTGNCTFSGNNEVQASVYCEGTLTGTGNLTMTGTFVAKEFNLGGAYNTYFLYDPAFDSAQPPGFRYLEIPKQTETGNQ